MEVDRKDSRRANQLRPLSCSRNVLNRAHGSASWSQGDTKVLAAVYGPKAGTKKNENPEKACFEVIWKPKMGQIGKVEKEYEMILKRTVQSICVLNVHPNTTTSIIIQVVNDDGALLPCAINALCAALVDAGIPLKHLAVAICCCLAESGHILLDPSKLEEQRMKAFVYLVFPNSTLSVLPEESLKLRGEPMEHGLITSFTHGVMSGQLARTLTYSTGYMPPPISNMYQLMTTFVAWSEDVLPLQSCLIFSGEACNHKSKVTHPSWVKLTWVSKSENLRLSKSIDSFMLDLCWQILNLEGVLIVVNFDIISMALAIINS